MKEQRKKRIIVLLLFVSCTVSGYLLWAASDGATQQLRSFAQADSLIERELGKFSIPSKQITASETEIDSSIIRKTYQVDLPAGFSKTQLHAELNRRFYPLGISTPTKVTFPEHNMNIHFQYRGTIFRTLELRTDSELTLHRNQASVIVAFEGLPDEELLTKLMSMGEPIPIVLSITHPMQANELLKSFSDQYDRILFWLQNDEGEDLIQSNSSTARRRLNQFENVVPNADLLLVGSNNPSQSNRSKQIVAQTALTFVDAREALRLHEELGKASFFEELHKLTSAQSSSLAIITGTETTLNWLDQKLPELKKGGVELVPPPKITF